MLDDVEAVADLGGGPDAVGGPVEVDLRQPKRPDRAVLVVGSEEWAIAAAVTRLTAAGGRVARCQANVEQPFPCRALDPAFGCPLDTDRIGAVLAVRGRPGPGISAGEMGAVCGLRAGVPVVLAGFAGGSALEAVARRVPDTGDLVGTCTEAMDGAAV